MTSVGQTPPATPSSSSSTSSSSGSGTGSSDNDAQFNQMMAQSEAINQKSMMENQEVNDQKTMDQSAQSASKGDQGG